MNTNNTNNIDYLAIDALVRRAHRERSAALGELVGQGLVAAWAAIKRIARSTAGIAWAALQPPRNRKPLPHYY